MKIALNFIVNINQKRNNHESTYFNLVGLFFANFWHSQKCLLDFKLRYLSKYSIKILVLCVKIWGYFSFNSFTRSAVN